jgi:hypothetical protein
LVLNGGKTFSKAQSGVENFSVETSAVGIEKVAELPQSDKILKVSSNASAFR